MSKAALIVIAYNSLVLLRQCLDSLLSGPAQPLEDIVVVDNASSDGTADVLPHEYPQVHLIPSLVNLGYGGAANEAIKCFSAPYLIVSNVDVIYPPESIAPLIRHLQENPGIGAVGPQQVQPDGAWQRSHGSVPGIRTAVTDLVGITSLRHWHSARWRRQNPGVARDAREVGYLDGAILVLRRRAIEEAGAFDTAFPFYSEDADLCHRLRELGWRLAVVPRSEVVHLRGEVSRKRAPERYAAALTRANARFAHKHLSDPEPFVYLAVMTCHFFVRHCLCRARQLVVPQARVEAGDRARYFWGLCVNYARVLLTPSDELC